MAPSSTAVLIVGAGELGESILTALSSHSSRPADSKIDVLLRADSIASPPSNVKKASNGRLRALGATLIPGNFVDDNISELAAIFKGYDVVIQAGGYGLPKGTQLKVTRAVLQAGVERYLLVTHLSSSRLSVFIHDKFDEGRVILLLTERTISKARGNLASTTKPSAPAARIRSSTRCSPSGRPCARKPQQNGR